MMQQILTKVITNLFQTDPALVSTVVDAIAKSGSNVPLIGVTNGVEAQPGQVGEWVQLMSSVTYTAASQSQVISMGVLQPGDWDCWLYFYPAAPGMTSVQFELNPLPAGFSGNMYAVGIVAAGEAISLVGPTTRGLTSAPTVIAVGIETNNAGAGSAGTGQLIFMARRAR